jgi:hypothetical protein
MHILIGVALACGLLYFWLVGHWFGRVLAFLVFAGLLGLGGGMALADSHAAAPGAFGAILGIALAWPVSGIPIYVRRAQIRAAG